MQSHTLSWLLALVIAAAAPGCRTSAPTEPADLAERQALEQRVSTLRDEAMRGGMPTLARRAEYRQLANDVRAWQRRTGTDDLRVTQESQPVARRADGGGGEAGCDCPGYRLEGDRICFLERADCPVNEGGDDDEFTIVRSCLYSCIWIGSSVEPDALRKGVREH